MDIVIADAAGAPVFQTGDHVLDMAYGDDENDFELSGLPHAMARGWRWWFDGTAWGGIVDTVCPASSGGVSSLSYKGRSVQGLMAAKVVEPDAGKSHLVVSGDANAVLGELIGRCSLDGWLRADTAESGVAIDRYRFHRYIDLYNGIRMMLAASGARLRIVFRDGAPVLSAVERGVYGSLPSETVDFSAERTYRPVNHLIGLGKGEGAAREVSHWYADASGSVSQKQTLTGLDEVAESYDLSNESDDLPGKTRDKLAEYQGQGSFDVSLPEGAGLDVGDVVTASDASSGISVEAEVVKVIVKSDNGQVAVEHETGSPAWPDEEA